MDHHLSGELPGRPPEQWFREHRLACCRVCGLSLSTRVQGQIHPRCYNQFDQQHPSHYDTNTRPYDTTQLPTLHTIFCANIRTKEHLPKSLLPLIRTEYGKLLAAVNEASRPDAWDYLPVEQGGRGVPDTEACQAARKAWLELFLFPKCVLRQFRRGQRPQQSYHFTKSLLIRWRLGERQGLWDEAIQATARKPQTYKHPPPSTAEAWGKRATEIERLAGLGRASQAIHRLGSPGLAYDTPTVRQKLFGKFPPIPVGSPSPLGLEMPPAPHIPIEQVIKAIKSFAPGVGPGPDGLRADYLKQIMGPDDDDTIIPLYRDFVQLLVDGLAPAYLRPWLAGGQLIGIGKVDAAGIPIPLDQDARPIVMGLTWRKIAFKCTLAMDKARIQERLAPSQLAVGVPCGAEIMVHAARHCIDAHQADANYVLLQKDIRNAFNEVLPYEFLKDAQEHAPSSARFAAFCYGTPSHLIYNGTSTMCFRGQQGCPIMGPLFCLTRQRMIEEARHNSPRGTPDFEPAFADDAFSGGDVGDVWASFQQELNLVEKYGLHMDPSKCTLYLLAGDQFRGDVSRFQALGVKIVSTTDVMMLKVPVSQATTIFQSFHQQKIDDFRGLCKRLLQLPHAHIALYLMRQGGTYNKIQYWCRTMPRRILAPFCKTSTIAKNTFWINWSENHSPLCNGPKPNCPLRRGVLALWVLDSN